MEETFHRNSRQAEQTPDFVQFRCKRCQFTQISSKSEIKQIYYNIQVNCHVFGLTKQVIEGCGAEGLFPQCNAVLYTSQRDLCESCLRALTTYDLSVQQDLFNMFSKRIPDNSRACPALHLRPSSRTGARHNGRTK